MTQPENPANNTEPKARVFLPGSSPMRRRDTPPSTPFLPILATTPASARHSTSVFRTRDSSHRSNPASRPLRSSTTSQHRSSPKSCCGSVSVPALQPASSRRSWSLPSSQLSGPLQARRQSAAEDCNAVQTSGISVGDKGPSITIDTKGEDDSSGASLDDASCILSALSIPDSVISQIDDTSAMDGRQSASWDGVDASWTSHPDSGMKLILAKAKK